MEGKKLDSNRNLDKRFFLFAFDEFYPSGGISDLILTFDSQGELKQHIKNRLHLDTYRKDIYEIYQLVDTQTNECYALEGYEIARSLKSLVDSMLAENQNENNPKIK